MHKLRILIIIGVLLVAFALVGTSLAAASQARQAASLADISKSIHNSSLAVQAGHSLPAGQIPPHTAYPDRNQASAPDYTPYLPAHPTVDRQLPDGKQPGSEPKAVLGDLGDWDSSHAYAPTILDESGTLYMWYSGIDWDGNGAIGLATSTDGIAWTKSLNNPFLVGSEGSIIKVGTNDYRMYYANWDDGNIYVALSTDGMDWTPQPGPVFTATHQAGDWDADFVGDPMVYFDGISYFMFYEGGTNDPNIIQIGLATSDDGLVWTRYQADPVLSPTSGEWDDQWVLDPMVVVEGPDWRLWYRGMGIDGSRAIGYATSSDAITWTKHPANPVFTANPGEWDDGGPSNMWVMYDGTYQMWYYANRQIGYATSDDGINWVRPVDDAVLKPSPLLYLEVNYAHDWAHIYTLPNETVTVTLEDESHNFKGMVTGKANSWGDFWSGDWQWYPEWQYFNAFDSIYIEAVGLSEEVEPIGEIQGVMDVDNDTVVGSLNAPWFTEVQMACELWSDPGGSIDLGMVSGNGGTFECDWGAEGIDLQPGMQVALVYYEPDPDGDRVINIIETPWMRVNYGHDWVGGNYPPGHTFNITLYDGMGQVKATAQIQSETGKGWGGDGFETRWEDWSPPGPNIQPYDKVTFQSDDGFAVTIPVGDIQGTVDIDQDLVSGPVYADWYTDDLNIECHPWGGPSGTPTKNSTAGPDGDPPYTCDWGSLGEWDIQPGQDIAVMYFVPDSADRVINVFHDPAPNMRIEKWAEGSGQVLPGGPVIFTIRYTNDGEAAPEYFTITDTLPTSTTYLTDSAGVPATTGDGWVAWDFGPIDPGEWGQFQVVLINDAQPGTMLENWAEISAPYDFDDGNDHTYAQAWVGEGNYNLYVNKSPNPGDPTPGETFIYNIDYGNQDGYASGAVTLTETLPEGTSLVDWYSWNSYNLWEQVSYIGGQLVLSTPSLPGYWGDQLRLTLRVDESVPYGTQLTNTVEITTPGDVDPWNDWYQNTDAWVNPPRLDGRINKQIPWGTIVPGGEPVYPISFSNDGNTTFDAVITDTLPEGMSFVDSPAWMHGVEIPFDPIYVDDQMVVWDYSELPPGEWIDVDLRLAIDPDYQPGTSATNCIELDTGSEEATPFNNVSCVEQVVQDAGPNLRLTKHSWWNGEGQLQYQLDIQNIGTAALDSFWVTDTYPLSTTWNGNWWSWGRWITVTPNITDSQMVFWVEFLNPSENAGLAFQVDLDGEIIGEKGLLFTNHAEAPIDGDINPADNTDEVTSFTGADVYIEKWLSGGTPLPGEIITFTVEFGNLNQSPWDGDSSVGSHITDTLPAGMTFITATAPWNATQFWTPESQEDGVLRWGWGTMWAGNAWRFDLVVQLAEDLEAGDVLSNFIEAYGDNPEDYDFDWSNNFSEYDVTILGPEFELSKSYAGNPVAGALITYTLELANVGYLPATGILLSDTVPLDVDYVDSDGTLSGADLLWTFDSLDVGESATGWFAARLPCTVEAEVVNEFYRVVSSDQGATTPFGSPVSLTTQAPTLTPGFDISPGPYLAGKPVTFTSTSASDGGPLSYAWDFGDGAVGEGAVVEHSFVAGSYTVSLTVSDACGYSAEFTFDLEVLPLEIFLPVQFKN